MDEKTKLFELVFPIVGARPAFDCPVSAMPGENVRLTVPAELFISEGWEFTSARLSLSLDPGLTAIGGLIQVRDGDLEDGIEIVSHEQFIEEETTFVEIELQGTPPLFGTTATLLLDIDTAAGRGGEGGEVVGNLQPSFFSANKPHPLFQITDFPLNADIASGGTYMCKGPMYKGCIIYVRTTPEEGQAALTDKEICQAHNAMNDALREACIYLDKRIAPLTVIGDPVERRLTSNKKLAQAINHIRKALSDAKVPLSHQDHPCILVGIMNKKVKGKAASLNAPAGHPLAPLDGSILMGPKVFGATRSLPHEVGHILDGRPQDESHRNDRDNLMTPTDGRRGRGTELDAGQIMRMQGSKWLRKSEMSTYYCLQPGF